MSFSPRLSLSVVAFLVCCASGAQPQPQPMEAKSAATLLAPLNAKLAVVTERATYFELPERKLFEELQDVLLQLEDTLSRAKKHLPSEYEVVLTGLEKSLPRPEEVSQGLTQESKARLAALSEDLRSKNRYFQTGMGATSFVKDLLVMVEVKTTALGKPVDGYEVAFSPAAFPPEWPAPFPFSSLTNQSRRKLPPGIYTMTLSRAGTLHKKRIEVGERGLTDEVISFNVTP